MCLIKPLDNIVFLPGHTLNDRYNHRYLNFARVQDLDMHLEILRVGTTKDALRGDKTIHPEYF